MRRKNPDFTFKCSLSLLLLGMIICNVIYWTQFGHQSSSSPTNFLTINLEASKYPPRSTSSYLRFVDPLTAYYVLDQLDIFEQANVTKEDLENVFNSAVLSTIPDNEYCKKHRAFIVNNPELIFEQKNIITSLKPVSLLRTTVIPAIGSDIQPHIWTAMPEDLKRKYLYELRPDANSFFTYSALYGERALGIQYSCLSQVSNAIPGHQSLYRKDYISEGVVKYAKSYESKPQCFNYNKFFPKTWILYDKDQCITFFRVLNSEQYQQLKKERGGIVFMRKIGSNAHQGRGVFPVNDKEEEQIKTLYQNGNLCGTILDNNIMQYFVYNPLLLDGHKFDFRVYMLIASANPLMAFYHDGFLRVSLHEYQPDSKELGALLTNTALSKSIFHKAHEDGTYQGMTEEELKDSHLWNFQRLGNYLYVHGIVKDPNWVDNYLRPEFRKAMAHLLRASQSSFEKKSSVYHLFGLDFMLDSNLNLWFIEANARPALEGFSSEMKDFVANLLIEHFEIVYGLMRSRMKRVIEYVNYLIETGEAERISDKEVLIHDLERHREYFSGITKNYFENEFKPSPENGFQPIVDENHKGEERYFGLILNECL